jgi:hypothetical protein
VRSGESPVSQTAARCSSRRRVHDEPPTPGENIMDIHVGRRPGQGGSAHWLSSESLLRHRPNHERLAVRELLEPVPQLVATSDCKGGLKSSYREKRVSSLLNGLPQRRKRRANPTSPESLRGKHGSIAVGMAERPHEAVVKGQPGRPLNRTAAPNARAVLPRVYGVAGEAPVHDVAWRVTMRDLVTVILGSIRLSRDWRERSSRTASVRSVRSCRTPPRRQSLRSR